MDCFTSNWKIIGILLGIVSVAASFVFSILLLINAYNWVIINLSVFGKYVLCIYI